MKVAQRSVHKESLIRNKALDICIQSGRITTMKAEFDGTCQLCGRVQRLPNGVLSKHGYTVEWGFFNGQCPGSSGLPYEQSTDLIAGAIVSQQSSIASSQARAAILRDPNSDENTGSTCWVNEYVVDARRLGAYTWRKVELKHEATAHDDFVVHTYTYVGADQKVKRIDYIPYELKDNVKGVRMHMNEQRAKQVFDKDVEQRTKYVQWLQKRVTDWTAQPLIPRKS